MAENDKQRPKKRPLPVIDIDNIQSIARPEQIFNRKIDPGLRVPTTDPVLFHELHEGDPPIFKKQKQNDIKGIEGTTLGDERTSNMQDREQVSSTENRDPAAKQVQPEQKSKDNAGSEMNTEPTSSDGDQKQGATKQASSKKGNQASTRSSKNHELWLTRFEILKEFKKTHGHTRVPKRFGGGKGFKLGSWVSDQRNNFSRLRRGVSSQGLDQARIDKLNEIDFEWVVGTQKKDHGSLKWTKELETSQGDQESARVLDEKGVAAGARSDFSLLEGPDTEGVGSETNLGPKEGQQGSNGLTARNELWLSKYEALRRYKENHGNTKVPRSYVNETGVKLGGWVHYQRTLYSKIKRGETLCSDAWKQERIDNLDDLDFEWAVQIQTKGTVKSALETSDQMGSRSQSISADIETCQDVTPPYASLLDTPGKEKEQKWQSMFELLKRYQEKRGHTRVPRSFEEDGIKLGNWVRNQKDCYSTMMRGLKTSPGLSRARLEQLNDIGFEWPKLKTSIDSKASAGLLEKFQFQGEDRPCKLLARKESDQSSSADKLRQAPNAGYVAERSSQQESIAAGFDHVYLGDNSTADLPVGSDSDMELSEDEADSDSAPVTAYPVVPSLSSDGPRLSVSGSCLAGIECDLISKDYITAFLEKKLMEQLDRDITAAEERELLKQADGEDSQLKRREEESNESSMERLSGQDSSASAWVLQKKETRCLGPVQPRRWGPETEAPDAEVLSEKERSFDTSTSEFEGQVPLSSVSAADTNSTNSKLSENVTTFHLQENNSVASNDSDVACPSQALNGRSNISLASDLASAASMRPVPRDNASRSLLKNRSECPPRRQRSLRFSDTVEERRNASDSMTGEFELKGAPPASSSNSRQNTSGDITVAQHVDGILSDAIYKGSFPDVLRFLESGAMSRLRSTVLLDQLRSHGKATLKSIRAALESDVRNEILQAQLRDYEMKDILLKVCMTADHAARHARALKNWFRFEVVLEEIVCIEMESSDRLLQRPRFISVTLTGNYPDLPSGSISVDQVTKLPSRPLSTAVSYGQSHAFHLNHNPMVASGRSLTIELEIESSNQSDCIGLGSVAVHLSDMHKNCPCDGGWWEVEKELPQNEILSKARLRICARRKPLDQNDMNRKREAECKRIRSVLAWVEKFNRHLHPNERKKGILSANVPVSGNVTLLHSAIFLEDKELVAKVIELGADPHRNSVVGSAIALAMNLSDGDSETAGTESMGERRSRLAGIQKILEIQGALACTEPDCGTRRNTSLDTEDLSLGSFLAGTVSGSRVITCADGQAKDRSDDMSSGPPQSINHANERSDEIVRIISHGSLSHSKPFFERGLSFSGDGTGGKRSAFPQTGPADKAVRRSVLPPGGNADGAALLVDPEVSPLNVLQEKEPQFSSSRPTTLRQSNAASSSANVNRTNRKRKAAPIDSLATSKDSSPSKRRATSVESALPMIENRYWLMRPGESRSVCGRFNMNGSCKLGPKCPLLHEQKPLGQLLSKKSKSKQSPKVDILKERMYKKFRQFKVAQDSIGRSWYTAGYRNDYNLIFYAEGGETGRKSSQKVWWYPSEKEAGEALKRVINFSAVRREAGCGF